MGEKEIHVRFYHAGEFNKTSYIGGESFTITRVELDTFSYTVLMEFVKDYLHYTEIGGVYSKGESGGWELVSNDKELLEFVDSCDQGEEVEFYIDNNIDKDIQPL